MDGEESGDRSKMRMDEKIEGKKGDVVIEEKNVEK